MLLTRGHRVRNSLNRRLPFANQMLAAQPKGRFGLAKAGRRCWLFSPPVATRYSCHTIIFFASSFQPLSSAALLPTPLL